MLAQVDVTRSRATISASTPDLRKDEDRVRIALPMKL
jgi:hypothetical protein